MSAMSYQHRRRLRLLLRIVLIVFALLAAFCIWRFLYVGRHLVYDETGAHLDYAGTKSSVTAAREAEGDESFPLVFGRRPEQIPEELPPERSGGYFVPSEQLLQAETAESLRAAAPDSLMILLDVKNPEGGPLWEHPAVSSLLTELSAQDGLTVAVRFPAFTVSAIADGCPLLQAEDGSPLTDEAGARFLDPAAPETLEALLEAGRTLAGLGADEICFDGFGLPDGALTDPEADSEEMLRSLAESLSRELRALGLGVSFCSEDPSVAAFSSHLFRALEDGTGIADAAALCRSLFPDDTGRLVFLTASHDTRFDAYPLLRPLGGEF